MRWECGECGECVDRLRPPTVCWSCGIAGATFVLAEREPDDASSDDSWSLQKRWSICSTHIRQSSSGRAPLKIGKSKGAN